ncbi:hypothetical protein [Streptomyces sp. MZ04]|uniref:hypothetical protein n=1 Tax=Streptomyces sp. MZ04 TaxID=2559236 RepID=UPI00107E98CB|nr:hypothetical protein [Streptomyces sp. MZ04]TGB00053.1 hypothetical protein E2651_29185 [Streptomyces sp. MZ04]
MADEDYRWLDRDAAERLLSGEPFDGADHHTRERAEQLAKTLDSLTADERVLAGPPGDLSAELPGEAAALAAFREARGLSAGASSTRVGAGQTVHIASPSSRAGPGRPTRWGRPVRFGLAAVLAGCMVGGVAVAAGTGVLPSPFGGRGEQGPAASASPVAPPQPLESASGGASSAPDVEPDDAHTTPDGSSREPGSSAPPRSPSETSDGGSQGNGSQRPGTGDSGRDDEASDWRRQVVTACREHRNGDLKGEKKRRLEKLLGGSEGITEACNRVLGDGDGDGGDREGDGSGSGSGGGEDGDNDGDNDGDGSSGGGNDPEGNGGANPAPPIVSPTSPRKPTPTASYSAQPVLPSPSSSTGS